MSSLPSQIGRYEIKSLIGRGGMGNLYLAHDPNTNRLVALKLLNATLDSSELRERFAREARALAALSHPNIVNIYDSGEFEDSPFIVMEYVRGETLLELIKRRAEMSVSQKLKLMAELCAGLAQAHEAGIIHRDIKPANLMVDQQGRLKILDFGIARGVEASKSRAGLPLTQVNMMIGTPGYMSPEQIEGGEVDHRSDIFAVGAVCNELLSYDEAFSGTNTEQIERRVLQAQPTPLATLIPGLDPEIDAIVRRAMKKDPNRRYPDAATFERALERLRARMEPEQAESSRRSTPSPPQSAKAKTHEARAEAAYQRAIAAYQTGAPEAARRFVVEALAEDPSHANARALLGRLQSPGPPSPPRPGPLPPTIISTSAGEPQDTMASAPTILISPADARATTARAAAHSKRHFGGWAGPRKLYEQLTIRGGTFGQRPESFWLRYRLPVLAVALVALVAIVGILAIFVGGGFGTAGQLLTITKPVGGTLSMAGINCGTRGADCSTSRPNGDRIELTPEADAGFTFVGYTGDCAPGGRTIMTAPRICGATFAPDVPPPPGAATQLLTIAPVPSGGTLEGVDILCGSKGSICSANHPEGVPVELHPTADPGFTFMGFLGDCKPLGHTQMTGPRTCSATFSSTVALATTTTTTTPPTKGGTRGSTPPPRPTDSPGSRSPTPPPTPPPPPPVIVDPATATGTPPPPPPTDEQFAKRKIQELLQEWCSAYEAIDPAAVKRVYPKVDMSALTIQLNKSKYSSVQCKFNEPVFVSLDAAGGTAKITTDVKRIYEHTIQQKPQTSEVTATITLVRSSLRDPWKIDTATYKEKPK
jgi:serine/threonine protein kinase